ncbi:MAG: fibronectin type III domain-containing protein [Candidatus Thermoplasmatota archaeon]
MGSRLGKRCGAVARLHHHFHVGDQASGTIVAFVVGAAVILVTSTVLIHFVIQQPGNSVAALASQDLQNKAKGSLQVLVGTPGYPATWSSDPDRLSRIGLLEPGSASRVDPAKFDALAKGRLWGSDGTNGFVDYDEAHAVMALDGYDFHIRASPIFRQNGSNYGLIGLGEYHIGYVGHYSGGLESVQSQTERAALAHLPISFNNTPRLLPTALGDAFSDESSLVKSVLLPELGGITTQSVIPTGSQTDKTFHIVDAAAYGGLLSTQTGLTKALALSSPGATKLSDLSYTAGKDVRAVLGTADFSELPSGGAVAWKEYVDTHQRGAASTSDLNDYGWLEVSPDAGVTWFQITNTLGARSADIWVAGPESTTWRTQSATITPVNCLPCMSAPQVQIAFHWHADNSGVAGYGWIVDDVSVTPTSSSGLSRNFETPTIDLLIIGSDVAPSSLSSTTATDAIRDYVNGYGGRLVVLGGEPNLDWLEPLLRVGIRDASPGLSTPDPTHPMLSMPNQLAWGLYEDGGDSWDFTGNADVSLFNVVLNATGSSQKAVLAASRPFAFSGTGQDGTIVLTTYLPWKFSSQEPEMFFANVIVYGKYHYLMTEFGPSVPPGFPVESATRTALMDRTSDAGGSFTEIGFTVYVWQGSTAGTYARGDDGVASSPLLLAAAPGNGTVDLTWTKPASNGTSPITGYDIYRSTGSHLGSYIGTTASTSYHDPSLANGVTYYYNVTATNTAGQSSSSQEVSATPSAKPMPPLGLTVTGDVLANSLSWSAPWSDNGAPIIGYNIFRNDTDVPSAMVLFVTESTNTSWIDVTQTAQVNYTYAVSAINAVGESVWTDNVTSGTAGAPGVPTDLVATPGFQTIVLAWTTTPHATSYAVYAGNTTNPTDFAVTVTSPSWQESGLGDGVTRHYRVIATNDVGPSTYSADASATTVALPGVVLIPTLASTTRYQIDISWTSVTPPQGGHITGYRVYSGADANSLSLLTTTTGLNASETGLSDGQTRYYAVSAVDEAGEGPQSPVNSATTLSTPAAPTQVVPTSGANEMVITWTPPPGLVTNYTVYAGDATNPITPAATVTAAQWTETGLTAGQTRHYRVTATNAVGTGPHSSDASGTTLPLPIAPGVPTVTAEGRGALNASWSAVDGATSYDVYGGPDAITQQYAGTTTSLYYVESGLGDGVTRYYAVEAANAAGHGQQGPPASGTTFERPAAPTGGAAAGAIGEIYVSWTAPSGTVTNYTVYAGSTIDPTTVAANVTVTHWTETGLSAGETRHYRIIATNPAGNSTYSSDIVGATVSVPIGPEAPTLDTSTARQINVSWTPVDGATEYEVYRGESVLSLDLFASTTGSYYLDAPLGNGATFYYAITAASGAGEGPRSNPIGGTTMSPPAAPTAGTATSGVGELALTWTPPTGPVTNYSVYAGDSADPTTQVANVTSTSHTETGLANGVTRHYRIIATNGAGNSTYSSDFSGTTLGIPAAPGAPTLTLPDVGKVNVSWGSVSGATSYKVYGGGTVLTSYLGTTTSLYYVDSGLENGALRYYNVTAVSTAGEGASSPQASTTTANVSNVPAFATSVASSHVTITITPPSDGGLPLLNYTIWRCGPSAACTPTERLASVGGTNTTFVDATTTPGTPLPNVYWYYVTAWNAVGESNKQAVAVSASV